MAHQTNSTFTRYQLSEDEAKESMKLTQLNLYMIQNLICDAAEEKIGLKFDPLNPLQFAQREAELQGHIGILKLIVEMSSSTSINFS